MAHIVIIFVIMNTYTLLITLILLSGGCTKGSHESGPSVSWSAPRTVCKGGYGRIHPLADGSLMLTYSLSGSCYARTSRDGGLTWGSPTLITEAFDYEGVLVRCSNPEFVQLSSGRILFATNLRPKDNKSTVHPFSIAVCFSDDGGSTWSERKTIYAPPLWDEDVSKGAWEPFPMELPDGRIRVYFTDNTPHYSTGDTRGNNISYVESSDGGENWSGAQIVCHTPGGWDGMPVVASLDGSLYLSVEHKDVRGSKYPMEVKIYRDGEPVILGHRDTYCGAPYIIRTDNYFVLSCQSAKGSDTPLADTHSVPAVWFGKTVDDMREAPQPLDIDQTQYSGLWNSLCPIGGDSFYLVTQSRAKIIITKGTIK